MKHYSRFAVCAFHGILQAIPLAAALAASAETAKPSYTTIDVTGAVVTFAQNINQNGVIVGFYESTDNDVHGYVRSTDGTIESVDGPDAVATYPGQINNKGEIVGYYHGTDQVFHGFFRTAEGAMTMIDGSGAGTGNAQGTITTALTENAVIAGYEIDRNGVNHGIICKNSNHCSVFDAPDAGAGSGQGTVTYSINDRDETAGYYIDSENVQHGFVRTAAGNFTEFDVPTAVVTAPFKLNNSGVITGCGPLQRQNASDLGILRPMQARKPPERAVRVPNRLPSISPTPILHFRSPPPGAVGLFASWSMPCCRKTGAWTSVHLSASRATEKRCRQKGPVSV
jgi:hypothetical protein